MSTRLHMTLAVVLAISSVSFAERGKVPQGLKDFHAEGTDLWIYNDIKKAMAEAKKQNKPIFVTFRCVPCHACKSFDAEVAKGSKRVADIAKEHFISVRQVEMKDVDLNLFQFDYDLNWAAMFINAEGVVYARYGTQSAEGPDAYNSIESLAKTMNRVVELHKAYPKNKDELTGKRGKDKPYSTALEMPGLLRKDKFRGTTSRQNCIHCHNIHDAEQYTAQKNKTFTFDMMYRYPLPENIGLRMDRDEGTMIKSTETVARRAGLRPRDVITHVGGQRIVSIADMQWVLHNLSDNNTKVDLQVKRGSKSSTHAIQLAKGWKKTDFSWRGSMWSVKPRPGFWAPLLKEDELRKRRLPTNRKITHVKWINTGSPEGRSAKNAGLRHGDVIIGVGNKAYDMTPREFNLHLRLNYRVGDKLPLTVLRGGKKMQITIPLVE
jgi:hypothetical protein